ncbi:Peptidase S28 [Mycena kentingensis (nom. inval.)]|nr:Peptidase S28 [Mycena kentingensis (nom. inval.)]
MSIQLILCLLFLGNAAAIFRFPRLSFQQGLTAETGPTNAQFIEMPLDHFTSDKRTFKNRFWVNESYYEPGGPVFFFDSGEQNAEPLVPYYLQELHGLSAVMRLAKRYRGVAVLWEHRYYGASLPFAVNGNTTAAEWAYLNTEQALEDVVFFANSFPKHGSHSGLPIHPSVVPWIFLGGSYPGMRAAFLRKRNPEIVFAAWASSAPVQAQVDMSSYYKAAERSLTRNCSADWVAVTKYVDETLRGTDETLQIDVKFALLKARLSGPGGNSSAADGLTRERANATSSLAAAVILMEPLDFYQYYGFQASLLPFCDLLETKNATADAVERGIVSKSGVKAAFDAFMVALAELDYDSIPGNADDPVQDMSWMRQYCSEYGYYQRGDATNPVSIETSFLSLEHFQQQCNEAFPDLPSSPQVHNVNKYGGWDMTLSNVLFTNGEFDPWRTLGLASIESNSPQRKPSASVPTCNVAPDPDTFFGMVYANMVHVSDMRTLLVQDENHSGFKTVGFYSPISQEPFYTGLGLFQLALDEWLPCFGGNNTGH